MHLFRRTGGLCASSGLFLIALSLAPGQARAQGTFFRGDCTQDQDRDIADPIQLLNFLFLGTSTPRCLDACDFDDSGDTDISDAISSLSYLFLGGPPPPPPLEEEGVDPTMDGLSCANGRLPVLELRVVPEELVFYRKGESQPLTVIGVLGGGPPGAPPFADLREDPRTTYRSERPEVARVSPDGVVTAVEPGTTVIHVAHQRLSAQGGVRVAPEAGGAPVLRIAVPPGGAVVTSESVTVAGTVSDPSARVTVNRATAPVAPGSGAFSARVNLSLGPQTISVVATGAAGSGGVEIAVVRALGGSPEALGPDGRPLPHLPPPYTTPSDRTPPRVEISSPASGALLSSAFLEVRGAVDDPSAAVRVNGVLADVEEGVFRARLTLPRGPSRIEAEAVDPVGNRGVSSVEVRVDAELPSVAITEPLPAGPHGLSEGIALASGSPVLVRGTLSRPGMRVWVNGMPAAVAGTAFTASADLERGLNRVAAIAEIPGDPPRRAVAVRQVVLDLDPPVIEVAYPPDGHASRVSPVMVAGRVRDPGLPAGVGGPPSLTINGSPVPFTGASFEAAVALSPGSNVIRLRAVDASGRESAREVPVLLEAPVGPSLEVVEGAGQSALPGAATARPLVVRARDSAGSPVSGVKVLFRVGSGDGVLQGGLRERQVPTDSSGEARTAFTAGLAAGRGLHVVTARALARSGSPVAFITTVTPGPLAALAAHSPRWETGVAGFLLERPVAVRALDAAGNPLEGVPVEFQVVSGPATAGGETGLSTATGPSGVAAALVSPGGGPDDSRSTLLATAPGGFRVTFTVDSRVPGAPADTRLRGSVTDQGGAPLAGVTVRSADLPDLMAVSGEGGRFDLAGLPGGPFLLEFLSPAYAGARREITLVPGRANVLPEPVRLIPLDVGSRMAEIPVSEVSGGTAAVPAVPGMRLEVAPGAARFPGGSRTGRVKVVASGLESLGAVAPDTSAVDFPVAIFPEGVRFDPPAKLFIPNPFHAAGREVALFMTAGGAFLEMGVGRVGEDGAFIESLPGMGIGGGGLALYAVPGPSGGQSSALEGRVVAAGSGTGSVPQRAESPVVGRDVYAHSGEFFLEAVDLTIPGRGLDYRFRRRYESRHAFRGSLGHNWEHEYADRRLEEVPGMGNLLRTDGNGRFDEYLLSASSGGYISPVGVFARLFRAAGGKMVEREPDGTRYLYHPLDGSGLGGRLLEIADRSGNRISIARDARGRIVKVTDTMGRTIDYRYDAGERIESVRDFAGRLVKFTYDSGGDLAAVTGPPITGTPGGNDFPDGRMVRYEYVGEGGDRRLEHNLIRVFAPNEAGGGPPCLVNHYDEDPASPSFDRVVAQDRGGRNASGVDAGGRLTIEYRIWSPSPDVASPEDPDSLIGDGGTTVVIDRRGERSEIDWNRTGLATAVRRYTRGAFRPRDPGSLHPGPGIDPPFFETRHRYSAEGLLVETLFPRGNRVVYERDEEAPLRSSRGAVVREVRHPAPGAPGRAAPETTTWVRDPLFDQPIREVGSRGNDASLPGDPPLHATLRFLDYQEGNEVLRLAAEAGVDVDVLAGALVRSGLSMGLGDLNGDGDTSGTSGNVVRTVHPPATLPDGTVQEAFETAVHNHFGQFTATVDPEGAVTRFEYHPETDPDGDGQPTPAQGLNPNTGGYLAERIIDSDPGGRLPPAGLRLSFAYDSLGNPVRRVDGRGHATELTHNAVGELVQYRAPLPLAYRRWFRYDSNGNLSGVEVENFTANPDGFPLPVLANRWIESSWTRDILDRVVEERHEVSGGEAGPARVAVTAYRYDPGENLMSITHPEGNEERFTRDERGLVVERTRGGGTGQDPGAEAVERFDHDENGNPVRITAPPGEGGPGGPPATEYRYDGFDRLVARTDAAGGAWTMDRDAEGLVVSEAFVGSPGGPPAAGGDGNVLLFRRERWFDERGREFRTSTARFGPGLEPGTEPAVETRFLDRAGRTVRRIDPAGGTWTDERNGAGRPVRSTDPLGNSVSRLYDANGNLVAETGADLSDAPIDPQAGAASDPDYDPEGRFRRTETRAFAHDPLDRLSVAIDGAGRTRRFRYDSRDHLVHSSDAVGTVVNAGTDPELAPLLPHLTQRQTDRVNSPGNQTRYEYDGRGRLFRAIHELRKDGDGQRDIDHGNPFNDDGTVEERWEWDGNGRLAAWTDDRGNRTAFVHDRLDRPRLRTDPQGGEERYEYDPRGNLVKVTGRAGTVIRQTFDALDRPVRREVEPAAGEAGLAPEGTRLQLFEYDGLGRPTLAFDGNRPEDPADDQLILRGQDSLGGLAFECQGPYRVTYRRDAAGRPLEVVYPDGLRVETPRDLLGRVRQVHDQGRPHAAFRYLGAERILARELGNGIGQDYLEPDGTGVQRLRGWGPAGEIEREVYRGPAGGLVVGFEYGHDRAGRRLYERRLHRQGNGPAIRYDSIGRPREFQPDLFDPRNPPVNPLRFTRLYPDGAHNPRLSIVDFVETRIEVDSLDRLSSVGTRPLVHDGEGNLASAGGVDLRYDAFGRLARVLKDGVEVVRLAHDAAGAWSGVDFRLRGRPARRVAVVPGQGETGGAVRTLFSGELPIEERFEAGGLARQYVHGPDGRALSAIDFAGGGRAHFYLSDGAGSVAAVADGLGALLEEVSYDVLGAPLIMAPGGAPREASEVRNRLLLGARRWEPAARLYEVGSRHYSPALGRHVSPGGPAVLSRPLGLNRYAVLDPVNGFAPSRPETEVLPALPSSPSRPISGPALPGPNVPDHLPVNPRG